MQWEIDATHSQATFAVKHLMISTGKGRFNVLRGKLNIDQEHQENAWIEAEADAASIDTGESNRDNHLRSPDFFDVQRYPLVTFKSTKVELCGQNEYRVVGDLTMHGMKKEVALAVEYRGQAKDFSGKPRAGLNAKTLVKRKDFGLTWNVVLESGGMLVGEEVKIEIDLQVVSQEEAA